MPRIIEKAPTGTKDQQPQQTLPHGPRLMKATLSNSATINALVNQAMMLISGQAAQTEAGSVL